MTPEQFEAWKTAPITGVDAELTVIGVVPRDFEPLFRLTKVCGCINTAFE
jgi:hypothetical protein